MKFDKDGNVIDEEDDSQQLGTERADGDAGDGDDTERALAGKSDDERQGKQDERDASADELGDDPAKLKRAVEGLMKRLRKVTGQRNDARKNAGEIAALKSEIAKLSARREEQQPAREQPAKKEEQPDVEKARNSVREALRLVGVTPEKIEQIIERQDQQDADLAARDTEEARGFLRDEMDAHNLNAKDGKLFKRWEFATGSEIAEDPRLLAAYRDPSTRRAAIRVAFERVRDGLANSSLEALGVDKRLTRIEKNREKVLGGGRGSATENVGEPEPLTPPANLKGDALNEWWKEQVRKTVASLSAEEA